MRDGPDVLVIGAGPTGLTLALQARVHGANVRIVERRSEPFRPSRALIVHPRTLEVLRPLGVTEDLFAQADTSPRIRLHLGARSLPISLGNQDMPDTAFPHLTLLRQADAEAVLTRALRDLGVRVERETELLNLRMTVTGPVARLRTRASEHMVTSSAVVGCDGVDSTVRTSLGVGWPGGIYQREVVLADLDLAADGVSELEPDIAHVVTGRGGLLFLFALGERAPWRLLATRPASRHLLADRSEPAVRHDELQQLIDDGGLSARIIHVAWSTRVRLQHRIAERYRSGPVFLAGDAAHASSPAGGTGMNIGIQDAINLGWKLGRGPDGDTDTLLSSYEQERRPVAQQVLALTHMIFWAESSTDALASSLRGTLAPLLAPGVPWLMRRRGLKAGAMRLLSQLDTDYRHSTLSQDGKPPRTGRLRAGDRLPDESVTCDGRRMRLHALTARPGLHVLLDRGAACPPPDTAGPYLHIHRLTDRPGAGVVVVRPDGYIGFSSRRTEPEQMRRWLQLAGGLTREAGRA
jgi:2-polyprenyl-6-methoxyphenol hydroxylase-like FAD-dependent oxidoreductase